MSRISSLFKFFGVNTKDFVHNITGLPRYFKDLSLLRKQKGDDKTFIFGKKYPVLNNKTEEAGSINGHYFHQDLYVAKQIFKANPKKHIDIGSRIDGFISHIAVFREVEVLDIRRLTSKTKGINFKQIDLMNISKNMINSCDSISSLHAIEHFGLGRYGDTIDYFGHIKAIKRITEILTTGGIFYFSVPIGEQRIEFNAHRVFSVEYLIDLLKKDYSILRFSYVNDNGDFFENVKLSKQSIQNNFNCNWGCGIFELIKK